MVDTNGDPMQGSYYSQQLRKAPNPYDKKHFHDVEKVLQTKKVNGKLFHYVKYLHYPDKFNAWVSEDDFVEGKSSKSK